MRWLFGGAVIAGLVATPLLMAGFTKEPAGFDLVFTLCTAEPDGQHIDQANCKRVHLSTDDGTQKVCQTQAPAIISDWMAKAPVDIVDGRAVAKWKCLPLGTTLPEDGDSI